MDKAVEDRIGEGGVGDASVPFTHRDLGSHQGGGTVVAWGDNGFGQSTVPLDLTGVVAVAAGNDHSLVLKEDGTLVAWGLNTSGQTNVPAGLTGVAAIAAGGWHNLVIYETQWKVFLPLIRSQ